MNKAVFLDRDGTINVEKHYLYKIEDFELFHGAVLGLKMLQEAGYMLIILTNQSGIGRGYYTEDEFSVLNEWMIKELEQQGVLISRVYYCPHLPDAEIEKYRIICNCRKPALGMFVQAMKDFNIDLSKSFAIGDKIRDCSICVETECRGYLIGSNEKKEILKAVQNGEYRNIKYADSLIAAAKKIVEVS